MATAGVFQNSPLPNRRYDASTIGPLAPLVANAGRPEAVHRCRGRLRTFRRPRTARVLRAGGARRDSPNRAREARLRRARGHSRYIARIVAPAGLVIAASDTMTKR